MSRDGEKIIRLCHFHFTTNQTHQGKVVNMFVFYCFGFVIRSLYEPTRNKTSSSKENKFAFIESLVSAAVIIERSRDLCPSIRFGFIYRMAIKFQYHVTLAIRSPRRHFIFVRCVRRICQGANDWTFRGKSLHLRNGSTKIKKRKLKSFFLQLRLIFMFHAV